MIPNAIQKAIPLYPPS